MHRTVFGVIKLLRPAQWVKNVFLFAAFVFGVRFDDAQAAEKLLLACAGFGIFCMLSSAVYAFNDLLDYREDALHPTKRNRPIASGAIPPALGGALSILLASGGAYGALRMPQGFALTAVGYLVLNLFYTLWGKKRVLLDVILIAIGFVMRALAGAQAVEVPVSAWLVVCTFTLCLFLGFGKRRCELAVIADTEKAAAHRHTLSEYSLELLSQLLSVTGAMAVTTFVLYTLDATNPTPHTLIFTTPLVFYAVFRYAMVIGRGMHTGPSDVLIRDKPFLFTAILWSAITLALIVFDQKGIEKYLPPLRYPGEPSGLAAPATRPAE